MYREGERSLAAIAALQFSSREYRIGCTYNTWCKYVSRSFGLFCIESRVNNANTLCNPNVALHCTLLFCLLLPSCSLFPVPYPYCIIHKCCNAMAQMAQMALARFNPANDMRATVCTCQIWLWPFLPLLAVVHIYFILLWPWSRYISLHITCYILYIRAEGDRPDPDVATDTDTDTDNVHECYYSNREREREKELCYVLYSRSVCLV